MQGTLDPLTVMPAFEHIEDALNAAASEKQVEETGAVESLDGEKEEEKVEEEMNSMDDASETCTEEMCNDVLLDSVESVGQSSMTMAQPDEQAMDVSRSYAAGSGADFVGEKGPHPENASCRIVAKTGESKLCKAGCKTAAFPHCILQCPHLGLGLDPQGIGPKAGITESRRIDCL